LVGWLSEILFRKQGRIFSTGIHSAEILADVPGSRLVELALLEFQAILLPPK
jgi:hypothetical protein